MKQRVRFLNVYSVRLLTATIVFPFLLVLSACTPVDPDPVTVTAETEGILISNSTPDVIYYSMYPKDIASRVASKTSTNPINTPSVKPQRSAIVRYDRIWGYRRGVDVLVYWWKLVRKGNSNQYQLTELHTVQVGT